MTPSAGAPAADHPPPRVIGLLLVPQFSMIAFSSAIEPLRLANRVERPGRSRWRLYSADGEPVAASNGIEIAVPAASPTSRGLTAAIVCAGVDVQMLRPPRTDGPPARASPPAACRSARSAPAPTCWPRPASSTATAAPSTGRTTDSLREEFPEIDISRGAVRDRPQPLHLRRRHGRDRHDAGSDRPRARARTSPPRVTDQLIHHRMRDADERQRMELRSRLGVAHPKLISVVGEMERCIERPLSCVDARRRRGCSTRQLERLFRKYIGQVADALLPRPAPRPGPASCCCRPPCRSSSIGLACGFVSASHFSKCYVEHFGRTPSAERKRGGTAAKDAA